MNRLLGVRTGLLLALAAAHPALPADSGKYSLSGGTLMGYTDGMNGFPWPTLKDPLHNDNRAGFYISQARLSGNVALDSTLSATAVWNAMGMDLQEAYLTKRWTNYTLRAGKLRGAGLKSATGEDEFERDLVNAPRYARLWTYWARTLSSGRDFGMEIERDYRGGGIRNRLFIRNANNENVINDEPSFLGGRITQVLGFDYALDWRISPYTVWGGHIGMLADRGWDQFAGSHAGWKAQYWFKSNAVADGSLNHSLDMGRLHIFNEALLMYLRDVPHPTDSAATQMWGVSSLLRFNHSERWSSLFRYEFTDPSDGTFPQDGLHMFTLGAVYHPQPALHPGMKFTTQYVRSYGEQLRHYASDDVFNCQFQMTF